MIIYPAEFLFVDTLAPESLRGSYYAAQNLAAVGGALSPIICGYLLTHSIPASMFYVLAGLSAAGGCLCYRSARRTGFECKNLHLSCIIMNLPTHRFLGRLRRFLPQMLERSRAFW